MATAAETTGVDADIYRQKIQEIAGNVSKVFVGKADAVELILIGAIGGLHVLIEDVPGVGKTTLAKALSSSLGLDFGRIQFTPDLLPGDIVGMTVWKHDSQEFLFKEGAIMHQFILADEINRASPRTQSSLLEAMQEESVTVDGNTYPLPSPFFVVATQNPSTFTGAFHLPEGEIDRFGISFSIGYPELAEEREIMKRFQKGSPLPTIRHVLDPHELADIIRAVADIYIDDKVRDYIIEIVQGTRKSSAIRLGASPRASLQLQKAVQARAFIQGRDYVIPEDVIAMVVPVLGHRIVPTGSADHKVKDTKHLLEAIVKDTKVPVGLP